MMQVLGLKTHPSAVSVAWALFGNKDISFTKLFKSPSKRFQPLSQKHIKNMFSTSLQLASLHGEISNSHHPVLIRWVIPRLKRCNEDHVLGLERSTLNAFAALRFQQRLFTRLDCKEKLMCVCGVAVSPHPPTSPFPNLPESLLSKHFLGFGQLSGGREKEGKAVLRTTENAKHGLPKASTNVFTCMIHTSHVNLDGLPPEANK